MERRNVNRAYLMVELVELETDVFKVREINQVIKRVYENEEKRKVDVMQTIAELNKTIVSSTNRKLYTFFRLLYSLGNINIMQRYINSYVDDIYMFADEDLKFRGNDLSREHIGRTSSFYYVTNLIDLDVIETLEQIHKGNYELSDLVEALGLDGYEESPEEYILNQIDIELLNEPDQIEDEIKEAMCAQTLYDFFTNDSTFIEDVELIKKTHKELDVFKTLVIYDFAYSLLEDLQEDSSWIREEIDEFDEEERHEFNEAIVLFYEEIKEHYDELIQSNNKDVLKVIEGSNYYVNALKDYETYTLEINKVKEVA